MLPVNVSVIRLDVGAVIAVLTAVDGATVDAGPDAPQAVVSAPSTRTGTKRLMNVAGSILR